MTKQHSLDEIMDAFGGVTKKSKRVKIYKTANKLSIMDVTASLDYYQQKKDNEEVYKGKIIFNITDIPKGKYLNAFVDKATTKVLMQAILSNQFNDIFNGTFVDYGGTRNEDPTKIRSRIIKVKLTDKRQYFFTIDEGKGEYTDTNSIQMIGRPETTVMRVVPFGEALEMAHEVYDYIRDQELLAVLKGKPLYTISNYVKEQKQTPTPLEASVIPTDQPVNSSSYVITMDPWKGKRMSDLTDQELQYIIEKTKGMTVGVVVELKTHAIEEIQKRILK